jgi:hypothetical protein
LKFANQRIDPVLAAAAMALTAAVAAPDAQTRAAAVTPGWTVCAAGGAVGDSVLPVSRLTALSDKVRVEAEIARVFALREREQRVSREHLAAARISIDFLFVAGGGSGPTFYFEASKTIPDAEGLVRVSVSGWLRGDGGVPRTLGSKSELQWIELAEESGGDREIPEPAAIPAPTASLVPLGVLATATEHIWVMRRAIGNGPLLVYEVGPRGVSLRPKSTAKACP